MKTKLENITPQIAANYLKLNVRNRTVKTSVVKQYAREMKTGRWLVTHQGIAFNEKGELIDGQHRLHAIIESGVSVQMNVTRGVDSGKLELFGGTLTPQALVDGGRKRSVGDQLGLYGYTNTNLCAAAARTISHICMGSCSGSFPVGPALGVLKLYAEEVSFVVDMMSSFNPGRKAAVVGALAFALSAESAKIGAFVQGLATGENIQRGQPVFALRAAIISGGGGSYGRGTGLIAARQILYAAYLHITGGSANRIGASLKGERYFCDKQRGKVLTVRKILGDVEA